MAARPRSSRIAATALLAGPVMYLAAESISAAAWRVPRYSYLHDWVSDLGSSTTGVFQGRAIDSPLHGVMNAGFLVEGLLFGLGLLIVAGRLRGRLRPAAVVLTVATVVGYVLLAAFHGSARAAEDGTLGLHFLGATLAIVGSNSLAIVLGSMWRRDDATRSLGRTSTALGVVALVAVVVLFSTTGSGLPAGLIERVAVDISVLWPVGLAVQLLRSGRRRPAGTPAVDRAVPAPARPRLTPPDAVGRARP